MEFVYNVYVIRNDFISIVFQRPIRYQEIIVAKSLEDANEIMDNKRKKMILFDVEEDIESIEYSLHMVLS